MAWFRRNSQLLQTMVSFVVTDISMLPAINAQEGDLAFVVDASGDPTVGAGWATYEYISGAWTKTAEQESLEGGGAVVLNHNDLVLIQGGSGFERYHLTLAQHDALVLGVDASSLHHHDSRYWTKSEAPRMFTSAGTPNGVVTPTKIGDFCLDTTNNIMYYSTTATDTGWNVA